MNVTLVLIPAVYFLLFLVWIVFTLANVYHVVRYAYWTRLPLTLVFVYLALAIAILVGTGWLLRDVDWHENIEFSTPSISIPDSLPDLPGQQNSTDMLSP